MMQSNLNLLLKRQLWNSSGYCFENVQLCQREREVDLLFMEVDSNELFGYIYIDVRVVYLQIISFSGRSCIGSWPS